MKKLLLSATLLALTSCSPADAEPKNVILLIGDGMGEAEIALTRNYQYDSGPGLYVDTIKDHASAIVISLRNDDPEKYAFVGDSASGGTALATGQLTSVRRIATTAQSNLPITTIAEEAKENGFNVGIVTTAVITDATPASFAAHVNNRYCMKNGDAPCLPGEKPIIDQMLEFGVDVMLGGGGQLLPAAHGDQTIEEFAKSQDYQIIKNSNELSEGELSGKDANLWGIFADYHMPREWQGPDGKWAQPIETDADNNVIFPKARRCEVNPDHSDTPTLAMMSKRALDELSNKQNDKGFFLMIEGASIDKASHDADPCGSMGEMVAFDKTVEMAMEYAKKTPNTVVIVTADHGGATQNIHHPYYEDYERTGENIPGLYSLLTSNGGNELVAYYGTNREYDQTHSGINVPVFTYGMPEEIKFKGVIRQTDIKGAMAKYLFE